MADQGTAVVPVNVGDEVAKGAVTYVNEAGVPEDVIDQVLNHQDVARAIGGWLNDIAMDRPSSRRGWDVFNRDDYSQPKSIFDVMRKCSIAIEEDDVLSTLADTVEGLSLNKVRCEHHDEDQEDVWNQWARDIDLDSILRQILRELLKVSQVYVGLWWQRKTYTVRTKPQLTMPEEGEGNKEEKKETKGGNRKRKKKIDVVIPTALTIFDPTKVVPVGMLMFGKERFAYIADEYEDKSFQSVALGEQKDVVVSGLLERRYVPQSRTEMVDLQNEGIDVNRLWLFKEQAVFRHTLTRAHYERFAAVRLKSILPLLELKHHLRNSDRAALIGSTNFIVVITKGTDQLPAKQPEIDNLQEQARVVARMPILVGDHRLHVDIVTPATDNTLIDSRYQVLDARLVFKVLQSFHPQTQGGNAGSQIKETSRVVSRGLENRRHQTMRVLQAKIFRITAEMNEELDGAPNLSFTPRRISLDFNADVLKGVLQIRDRGDLSRETVLDELDYDQETEALRRSREAVSMDKIFQSHVPHDSPQGTPQQTGNRGGRPEGKEDEERKQD